MSSSQKQHRSDVPVGEQDKGEEDGEGELEEVPEPNDVVRVHAKVGCDHGVIRGVCLKCFQAFYEISRNMFFIALNFQSNNFNTIQLRHNETAVK